MDMPADSLDKFAVGQPVSRKEDPTLLHGEGRYSEDINLPGQLHAVMVRSRVAHGHLRGVDIAEASTMPHVRGIYTAADLKAAGIGNMPAASASASSRTARSRSSPARSITARATPPPSRRCCTTSSAAH